jgi:hypothetical protein
LIDPDARIWNEQGTEYTLAKMPKGASQYQKKLADWINEHCEGEWISTPTYVAFKIPSDAILFGIVFR